MAIDIVTCPIMSHYFLHILKSRFGLAEPGTHQPPFDWPFWKSPFCHWVKVEQAFASNQWEFQDPEMEALYDISGHILWRYVLT